MFLWNSKKKPTELLLLVLLQHVKRQNKTLSFRLYHAVAGPDFQRGPGFILLAQAAFLPSIISSIFTQLRGGGGRVPRPPFLVPPLYWNQFKKLFHYNEIKGWHWTLRAQKVSGLQRNVQVSHLPAMSHIYHRPSLNYVYKVESMSYLSSMGSIKKVMFDVFAWYIFDHS